MPNRKEPVNFIRYLQVASHRSTLLLGKLAGDYFPFYYIVEYPKSGGTWLGKMCASCLDISFPQRSIFPVGSSAVIHSHSRFSNRLRPVVYLVRDGRDVMVSYFFYLLQMLNTVDRRPANRWAGHAFGRIPDANQARDLLPQFIVCEMKRPIVGTLNWPNHVNEWWNRDNVVCVRYEDVLHRPASTIKEICEKISDREVNPEVAQLIAERYRFSRLAGRERGNEDTSSFYRKGTAGDWRNYFTKEAAEIFEYYGGAMLKTLGYENNDKWVDTIQPNCGADSTNGGTIKAI